MNSFRPLRSLVLTLSLAAAGCHAQTGVPATSGGKLSPELARRVEVMIRSRSEVPPNFVIAIGERKKSEVPNFDEISVTFAANGNVSRPITFLLSADGKTLAQFNKFDLSQDPKDKVPAPGRPGRGGPDNAPVLMVVFDDLECPFCAKMHAAMFPAILDRYKDKVHVVYLDFPLDQHPWAIHAAVDANCLAAESPAGYWNYVDYVHAHSAEVNGDGKSVAKSNEMLDKIASDEGAKQKSNANDLAACVKKQDGSKVTASAKLGETLGVSGTPAIFINGEKIDGVVDMAVVYQVIDGALVAAGQTPPPPPPVQPAAAPAPKPGN